jgi:GAF domain-containing protein
VVAGQACTYPERLQSIFPEDKGLVSLAAEAYLGTPLLDGGGHVIGHLAVLDTKPMKVSPAEVAIVKIFAARAGAELERVRAQRDVTLRSAELAALLDINQAIGHHLERDQLFGALALCLKSVVPAERFGIEIPIEGDRLQGHILSGMPSGEATVPTILPAAGTACNWVLQTRDWFVAGCREEFRERFPVTYDVMTSDGMESLCAIALVSGCHNRGALFFMVAERDAYRHLRREFLEQVANQIAIAIENVNSYEEIAALNRTIADTAARRRTVLEINNAIVTKLTRDEVFRAICSALARVVQYDRIALSLYDAETSSLRLVAYEGPLRTDYSPVGNVHDPKDSHVSWVFAQQHPLLRRDLETEKQFCSEERALKNGFRSLCALPLVVRGRSIGAITVASLNHRQYEQSDADFLMEMQIKLPLQLTTCARTKRARH